MHTLIATGVNAEGYREILGVQVSSAEDGAGWLAFFRDLVARGLSGWRWSPATPTRPGRRDRGHLARSGLAALPHPLREQPDGGPPKSSWPWVRTLLHCIFDQPDAESVVAQYDRVLDALSDKLPRVAEHLDAARPDLLAFTAFPNRSGAKSGATIPRNGSTKKSGAGPTSWASSPTGLDHPPRRCRAGRTTRRMDRRTTLPGLDVLTRARTALTSTDEPAGQQTNTTPALTA
ncbi:transposase, Mutator family protein [Mycobacterium xenopi 3993]|nr:transposase, Mutator family protein [Mycobacterium xenopi 3993]